MTSSVEIAPAHLDDFQVKKRLKLIRTFYYVLGGLGFIAVLSSMAAFVMGLILLGMASDLKTDAGESMPISVPIFVMLTGLVSLILYGAIMTVCVQCGRRIASPRRYQFCRKAAIFTCFLFPVGTVLGIFTLITLRKPEVKALFPD